MFGLSTDIGISSGSGGIGENIDSRKVAMARTTTAHSLPANAANQVVNPSKYSIC